MDDRDRGHRVRRHPRAPGRRSAARRRRDGRAGRDAAEGDGLPLRPETPGIIDAHALSLLPDGACVVNASRGAVLDTDALGAALATGRLGGAGLDVFETEPLDPSSPLLARLDVVATPHVGGVTDVSYGGIAERVADNVRRLADGRSLRSCVNWERVRGETRAC